MEVFSGETDFTFDKTTLRMIIHVGQDLYNSDATEISRISNDSADGQINASPKPNRSNINQQFQVPIETFSEQSNTVVRKTSRNIVKPVRYRDN
ncbi:hypothetical protein TNCV_2350141 [Trichonephila clavipes]|uniref:Uncharacterized protein n=1 Tax=Trichonephila clavipes TaxID=2585209 RepID=A0A8X6VQK5_TRICX|nr:hypothetical protein TNCV_2350141 [Trichonephila clavipes]